MEKMGAQELLQFKRFGHNDGLRGSDMMEKLGAQMCFGSLNNRKRPYYWVAVKEFLLNYRHGDL